jgi:GT2 family glycosyltransferase
VCSSDLPQSIVYHKDSASFKKVGGKRHYFHERNRIWFIYKFYPFSFIVSNLIPIALEEMRTLRRDVFVQKAPLRYLKARIHGIAGIFKYSKERKKNVRIFLERKNEFIAFKEKKTIPI